VVKAVLDHGRTKRSETMAGGGQEDANRDARMRDRGQMMTAVKRRWKSVSDFGQCRKVSGQTRSVVKQGQWSNKVSGNTNKVSGQTRTSALMYLDA
jgi:hypothetical protein